MQAIFHIGPNFLCNGYVTRLPYLKVRLLIINVLLCNGYVTKRGPAKIKSLIFNIFLCDGYVIGNPILFDSYLIKVTK